MEIGFYFKQKKSPFVKNKLAQSPIRFAEFCHSDRVEAGGGIVGAMDCLRHMPANGSSCRAVISY